MERNFFTSKQAAKIVGCTLRQLQYWREKGVVVPTIEGTGTGRSIYYSHSDLVELAIMEYLLSLGLGFATASWGLKELIKIDSDYANPETKNRWMLWWEDKKETLELVEFDQEQAIASLNRGQSVISVWLDRIHKRLKQNLIN